MTDIPDEIVQRMVTLVREMAPGIRCLTSDIIEARAIVALLPEPVDPDGLVVQDLVIESGWDERPLWKCRNTGDRRMDSSADLAYRAVKRGRELANQERKS